MEASNGGLPEHSVQSIPAVVHHEGESTSSASSTGERRQKNYPSPLPGSFHMTLLQCCHSKVSVCYGCKQSLKAGNLSPPSPVDLIIVTKMRREYVDPHEGMIRLSKTPSNVYFHCHPSCVQKQQPFFIPTLVTFHWEIKPLLGALHRQYIYENFGLTVY